MEYVSHYMKEKICLCTLLKAQSLIQSEEEANKVMEGYDFQYDMEQVKKEEVMNA